MRWFTWVWFGLLGLCIEVAFVMVVISPTMETGARVTAGITAAVIVPWVGFNIIRAIR